MTVPSYPTLIHERVELARRGENPTVICRMASGWAVLSDIRTGTLFDPTVHGDLQRRLADYLIGAQ